MGMAVLLFQKDREIFSPLATSFVSFVYTLQEPYGKFYFYPFRNLFDGE